MAFSRTAREICNISGTRGGGLAVWDGWPLECGLDYTSPGSYVVLGRTSVQGDSCRTSNMEQPTGAEGRVRRVASAMCCSELSPGCIGTRRRARVFHGPRIDVGSGVVALGFAGAKARCLSARRRPVLCIRTSCRTSSSRTERRFPDSVWGCEVAHRGLGHSVTSPTGHLRASDASPRASRT